MAARTHSRDAEKEKKGFSDSDQAVEATHNDIWSLEGVDSALDQKMSCAH